MSSHERASNARFKNGEEPYDPYFIRTIFCKKLTINGFWRFQLFSKCELVSIAFVNFCVQNDTASNLFNSSAKGIRKVYLIRNVYCSEQSLT